MATEGSGSGTGGGRRKGSLLDDWRPAPPPPGAPRSTPTRASSSPGRVTLDFSAPLLPLPEDETKPAPSAELMLELDSVELVTLPPDQDSSNPPPAAFTAGSLGAPRVPGPGLRPPSEKPLDLDLTDFDAKDSEVARREGFDAWTVDRRRRSTPPPFPGLPAIEPPALRRTPIPPKHDRTASPVLLTEHEGDALGLVDRNRPMQSELDLASEMAERYALGDFTGALRAAELVLGQRPDDPAAQRYAKSSRERLEQLYSSRLGRLDRVPEVVLPDRNIRWLGLDHRAAFLLSRIDGMHSVEEVLDVSGMPRLEALKTLCELLELKAIRLM